MTQKDDNPVTMHQALPQTLPRAAMIKKNTAVVFIIMAFALGLYGGHLISSLMNEDDVRITKQSIRQPAASPAREGGQAESDQAGRETLAALRATAEAPSAVAADWNRLGHRHYEQGQLEEALAAYTRSLSLEPGDSMVMTHVGILYRDLHQHEPALDFFRLAAKADPANEAALYYTGIACLDIGDLASAIEAWQELQKHNPGFVTPMGPTISQTLEMLKQQ